MLSERVEEGTAEVSAELGHAGMVTDKAIEHMIGKGLPPIAIASALLGGALGLLAQSMSDDAVLRVLDHAAASVRSGELRRDAPCGTA